MPTLLLAAYRIVLRHPARAWLAALALSLLASMSARQIELDDDVTRLFAHEGDAVRDLAVLERTFGSAEMIMALVLHAPGGMNAEVVSAIECISERLGAERDVAHVDSITATSLAVAQDDAVLISPVFGSESELELPLAERIDVLRGASPLGARLLSGDGTRTLISIRPRDALRDNADLRRLDRVVQQIATEEADVVNGGLVVHRAGIPSTRLASMDAMQGDLYWLAGLTGCAIFLVVWLAYRCIRTTLAILLPGGVAVAVTLGLLAWMGHLLNPLTAALPTLLIVMAIADGMHLASAYHGSALDTRRERAEEALGAAWLGCTLTTVTTVVGFSSLQLTTPDVLREFGRLAAFGISLAYVSVTLLVPAALILLRVDRCSRDAVDAPAWLMRVVRVSIRSPARQRLLTFSAALLLGTFYFGSQAQLDNYLLDALDANHPVSRGNRELDRHLGGMMPFEVWLEGASGAFDRPDNLAALWQLERRIHDGLDVSVSLSAASLIAAAHQAFGGDQSIPQHPAALNDLWFLVGNDDFDGLRRVVTPERDRARLTFFTRDGGARYLLESARWVDRSAQELFHPRGISVRTTGVPVVASEGTNRLSRELLVGLLMTVGVIILCIGIAFRSVSLAIASLVPNLLPIGMAVAFYGASGRYLDPVPAISFTIAIGIAVDDTIHLFSRYVQARRLGMSVETGIEQAVRKTYRPVVVTTVALGVGFALLLTSNFPPNRSLGVLVSATLSIALLADVFLTPAWLAWLRPVTRTRRVEPSHSITGPSI